MNDNQLKIGKDSVDLFLLAFMAGKIAPAKFPICGIPLVVIPVNTLFLLLKISSLMHILS